MASDMIEAVHCFVSEQGDLLSRWREAFPAARARKLGRMAGEAAPAAATAAPLVEPDSAGSESPWLLYGGAVLLLAGIITFIMRVRRQ